jgi:predicted metalloprotease with PDZ domain
MTPAVAVLEWSSLLLYPAGYYAYDLKFNPTVMYPHGWTSATSLTGRAVQSDTVQYPTVDLDRLVDSPVIAGAHAQVVDVGHAAEMDVFWDQEAPAAAVTDGEIARFRSLADQATRLFGHGNYEHYNFLIEATDGDGPILEHRRSSELRLPIADLSDPPLPVDTRFDSVSHEYTHSWNGKSRRPYDLWQPEFSTPQRGSLLWVYEGLTEYWGIVLATRSGFASRQTALDDIAQIAADVNREAGRAWRTLLDCTTDNAAPVRRPYAWISYQRREDVYFEGVLLWLEVDQIIRTATDGKRSLDDFAKAFFRLPKAEGQVSTYTFEDLVASLQKIAPYDWKGFFRLHLNARAPEITGGLERSGYDLVYTDNPSTLLRAQEKSEHQRDLSDSIGAVIADTGQVKDVVWGGPAFDAGVTVGTTVESVNGKPFNSDALVAAIQTAANAGGQIFLGTRSVGFSRRAQIQWSGGLRYPNLRRNAAPPFLDAILSPSADP